MIRACCRRAPPHEHAEQHRWEPKDADVPMPFIARDLLVVIATALLP